MTELKYKINMFKLPRPSVPLSIYYYKAVICVKERGRGRHLGLQSCRDLSCASTPGGGAGSLSLSSVSSQYHRTALHCTALSLNCGSQLTRAVGRIYK